MDDAAVTGRLGLVPAHGPTPGRERRRRLVDEVANRRSGPGLAGNRGRNAGGVPLLFTHYRRLGQNVEPGFLLPGLIAQTHTLRELSAHADSRTRRELLALGSRYAEYVGWLVQETGDEQAALWWTQRAVDLAAAGGDRALAGYALVRRALVTLYQDDAEQTVALAQRAQSDTLPSRIRGLAAQREAQGHALAGDRDACQRALERARVLLARQVDDADAPVIGPMHLPDSVGMVTGWCLFDLGRPREAAEQLNRQLARVSPDAVRTQVRYGVRRALAYAADGEIDHACTLTEPLLDGVAAVRSATVTIDLRRLARVWPATRITLRCANCPRDSARYPASPIPEEELPWPMCSSTTVRATAMRPPL